MSPVWASRPSFPHGPVVFWSSASPDHTTPLSWPWFYILSICHHHTAAPDTFFLLNHTLLGTEQAFLRLTPTLLNIYLFTWLFQGLVTVCRIFSGHMRVLVGPGLPTLWTPSLSHWITSKVPWIWLFLCLPLTMSSFFPFFNFRTPNVMFQGHFSQHHQLVHAQFLRTLCLESHTQINS